MAKIEELIDRISDPNLRDEIAAEVKALKKEKKFGLVFEEHLPESVRLPKLPIREGMLVAEKRESGNDLWNVIEIKGKRAKCRRPDEARYRKKKDEEKEFSIEELVAVKHFGEPIYPALTPVDRIGRGGPDKPWHTLINADNFHALQLLTYCYEGKVDVIYIDPPYNSGARDWKYNNDFVDSSDAFRHSKWLSMMKKRLVIAKKLLSQDGVLIITIDENEVFNLGVILRDIFPDYLHHTVTIVINPKGAGKVNFGRTGEHALFCVPKSKDGILNGNYVNDLAAPVEDDDKELPKKRKAIKKKVPKEELPFPEKEILEWEKRHARRRGNESSYRHQRPNQFYPIYIDEKSKKVIRAGESIPLPKEPNFKFSKDGFKPIWPIDHEGNHRCWRFIPKSMQARIEKGYVVLGKFNKRHETWTLNIWEKKTKKKKVKTVWWNSRHDAGTHGTSMLHKILGRRDAFPFPKSVYAVADALLPIVGDRPNAVVVDFFAGSGTTLHAIALINRLIGGSRTGISVSNNEVQEKIAKSLQKNGFFPGDVEFEQEGICSAVLWPRTRNVIAGSRMDGTAIPGNYLPIAGKSETVKFAEGFKENLQFFKIDFLNSHDIALGEAFEGILPILWMMAGCHGELDMRRGASDFYLPKESPFAVLIRENRFRAFHEALAKRDDITHVFLVTDSEDNFNEMRQMLGHGYECRQLYKNYLENFRINTGKEFLG